MVTQRMSFGFICSEEEVLAVQTRPSFDEQIVIDDYREAYQKAFGRKAHGLHYIPFPGRERPIDAVGVWLPIETLGDLDKPFVDPG
jgi:hypothetical protein